MIKILIVGADDKPGGVAGYVNIIIYYSNKKQFEFHMTVSSKSKETGVADEGIIKHLFPITYSCWSFLPSVLRLRRLIINEGLHLLHLHTARAGLLGVFAVIGLPVAIIYTGHSWRFEQKTNILAKYFFYLYERFICYRADITTFLTLRDKEFGIEKGLIAKDKAVIIHTRIDGTHLNVEEAEINSTRLKLNIPKNAYVIGNSGYMSARKDPLTFVRAAARIFNEIPQAYFLWVGDGELKEQAVHLATRLGINHRFIITGFVSSNEVPTYLRIMNTFLFTSCIEGVPLSILEAQGSMLPVVSSNYIGSGVKELIDPEVSGFIFPQGDDRIAAQFVIVLYNNKGEAKRLTENAYRNFEKVHSNPKLMAEDYEAVYLKVLRNMDK